ncbi:MAG: hypothetical protein QOH81_779 [Sphingomonadales bacterium]|jgi:hypothetical protein|nr:hypothetical protein [Sphingomonadales bacterium]
MSLRAVAMSENDFLYYQSRAEREIELAREARDASAAHAHALLAGYYLDLIYNGPGPSFHLRERLSG